MIRPFPVHAHDRPRVLILVACLFGMVAACAQTSTSIATRGKRFWTGFMQNGFGAQSLRVHILSSSATSGTISIPLNGWSTNFSVAANSVSVINVPTIAENTGSGSAQAKGVLIQSSDSINVFVSSSQNFTHDVSQVLPESSLGNNYRVDAYQGLPNFNNLHKSEFLIVATQDDTQLRITPAVNTLSGQSAGVPFVVDMDMGQTYQIQAATDQADLTGTLIEATAVSGACRPFAVFGGSMCATVPGACQACDAIFEQLLPTTAWGTRFYTVPIHGVNTSTYRVLAHTNGTQVSINGGAPVLLNEGQRYEVNANATPVCIEADRPVSVVQLMEGYSCAGTGDPSMLLVSTADRLSTSASWSTSNTSQVNQHSVSIVAPLAAVGQLSLDGVVLSPSLFQAYPGCADRRHARIPVSAGRHTISASAGFQAYMFGTGYGESYAGSVHDIRATPLQQDSVVCGSGPVTLNAPEPLSNATWFKVGEPNTILANGNSYSFTPTASGSYTVSGTLPISGCTRSFTYHVGIPLTIPTLLTANDQEELDICQYESVQLALVPPPDPAWFDIQWTPGYSLDNDSISNPVATPMGSTWYRVEVQSPSGCGNMIDSIRVNVSPASILDVRTTATPEAICVGASVQLASRILRVLQTDRFDGSTGAMWTAVQGGAVNDICGSQGGDALRFNGSGQRYAQTIALNTIGGGEIRFQLKIANGFAPCDDAEPGDDIVLEYSNNNGLVWGPIQTFLQNAYPTFGAVVIDIPPQAQTSSTMFRIRQLAHEGAGHDNWVIDDVVIGRFDNAQVEHSWSPAAVLNDPALPDPVATPTNSTWFVLHASEPNSSCSSRDSVFVLVEPTFAIDLTPNTTVCSVVGTTLTATPNSGSNISYSWGPNDGSLSATNVQSPVATPSVTTTYQVTATSGIGCSDDAQMTITVGQIQGLGLSASSTQLCLGQSSQLSALADATGPVSYSWSGVGLSDPSIPDPVVTPAQSTTYTCTATHVLSGCTLVESITIQVSANYTADLGPDEELCSLLGHQLVVQHNVPSPTYLWSPAANLNAANIASPTILVDAPETYSVTITDANGCSVSDQVTLTRAFDGTPSSIDVSSCADAPPTLSAPAIGTSYQWSTGATSNSIVATSGGAYTVTVTNQQGCQVSTTFNATLFPVPSVDLGPDLELCTLDALVLDANAPGSSVSWNTGVQGQQITVTNSGTYTATAVSANGCSGSDVIVIELNDPPTDELIDQQTCSSLSIILDAGNEGSTYAWSTGASSRTIVPTSSGVYSVNVTTPDGCSSQFDATITIVQEQAIDLGPDTVFCAGTSIVLDAEVEGGSYLWNNGAVTRSIEVTAPGTYTVEFDNGSCTTSDEVLVEMLPAPVDQLEDVIVCTGDVATLNAGGPDQIYLWSTGSNAPSILATSAGVHTVTVTNTFGCTDTFEALVSYVEPPMVQLGPDTTLCDGETLVLDGGNEGSSYSWSDGSNERVRSIRSAGTYGLIVDNGACTRSDTIEVGFLPSPARLATRLFHTCLGEDEQFVRIDAGNPGSRYDWSTGETSRVILAGAYGWYVVDVTNQFDCATRDSAQVVEYCPSAIFIPNTFTPNGDGINDVFIPVGKNIAAMHLFVFDRWGNLLFESEDPNTGWDGTYAGDVVKNDMYVWRLRYRFTEDEDGKLGREQEQLGHIQVLR